MADRRSVRASSRRKTPTPQPPSKPTSPQATRAPRTRALRSASRDIPDTMEMPKPARRSARQASVATATDGSENEGKATRRTKRKPAKEAVGDLTTVEEVEVQIDTEEAPATPVHTQPEDTMPYRSPGALSEMSGTTAISSFSMVEAEFLEPKYILKHMRKLCDSAQEFLDHLAPADASMQDDLHNIRELQKPDSDFTEEYRDFDTELSVHLRHYKSEGHNYIHVRALRRALFGQIADGTESQSGLELILYLANLLIFAKQMIPSDRDAKDIWDAIRQLDNSFPSQFMSSLIPESSSIIAGESTLHKFTFELALELRTQLTIMVLERSVGDSGFDLDEVIAEVFYRSESSQADDGSSVRGWNVPGLGRDDSPLPLELRSKVEERVRKIYESLKLDAGSLERGDVFDLEGLGVNFPWEATILRLVHWVRLRHSELRIAIETIGGSAAIVRKVRQAAEEPQPVVDQADNVPATRISPRKKRTSFGRERRRSSRKFDPNAPVDLRTIDALKARERDSGPHEELDATPQDQEDQPVLPALEEGPDDVPAVVSQQDDEQPALSEDQPPPTEQAIEEVEEEVEEPEAAGPPTSSADMLKALKAVSKPQKENRPVSRSLFDRQANAQRVDFGDGFDESQPTPGPSNTQKGKQPVRSSPKKRPAPIDEDDESGDDAFEAEERGDRVHERRQKAPVTKKVRIDPSSSGAPPSHQPPRHDLDREYVPTQEEQEQEQSVSEDEPPEMTEEPPVSTYQAQKRLAYQNRVFRSSQRERRAPRGWTTDEENALLTYMEEFPAQYSAILKHDKERKFEVLQHRSQVDLKDKARTMAINMIKSGTGLMPGFEGIIKHSSKIGETLLAQNYEW